MGHPPGYTYRLSHLATFVYLVARDLHHTHYTLFIKRARVNNIPKNNCQHSNKQCNQAHKTKNNVS
nr:MAG TPA: hypothetical protein [Caudoviricetes sp.]